MKKSGMEKIMQLNKRQVFTILTGSLIFSCFFSLGSEMELHGTCKGTALILKTLISFPVCIMLLSFSFRCMTLHENRASVNVKYRLTGLRSFLIIFICYLPVYVFNYPGTFCIDFGQQIGQIVTGMYSTNLPLIHTLYLYFCFEIMTPILGTLNRAAAFYSLSQTVILALCFAITCMSISRTCGKLAGWLSTFFFAVYPVHMSYAGSATKDVLFAGLFALTVTLCIEAIHEKKPSRKIIIGIIISCTLSSMFRSNMVYACFLWIVILGIVLKKEHQRIVLSILISVIIGIGANFILKTATKATSGNVLQEVLNWPAQQLARARIRRPEAFDEEEAGALDEVIVKKKWKEYDPYLSDPVKGAVNTKAFLENPDKYISLYFSVGKKCPQEYLDAVVQLCYTFFYPYKRYALTYHYIESGIKTEDFDACYGEGRVKENTYFSGIRKWIDHNFWKTGGDQIPVFKWIFNLGVIVWIMLFFVLREAFFGRWERVAIFLLPVILWFMYLFGPIMYSRYLYPIVCTLPVLAFSPKAE